MTGKKQAVSAILSVFPSHELFQSFIEDSTDRKQVKSFIHYACKNNLIKSENEAAFLKFLSENRTDNPEEPSSPDITIRELFDGKTDLLNIRLSNRAFIEHVNNLVKRSGIRIAPLSNSMFTRLKNESADTPRKRDALRSIAFWIGHERGEISTTLNYATLLKMSAGTEKKTSYNEGVRIACSVSSRGSVIGQEIIEWVKRELKDTIRKNVSAAFRDSVKVRFRDLTTLFIDFPKQDGAVNPSSFQMGIRNAIAVAHQISIRWALSPYSSQNRFLSIGIAAGAFADIDNHILPLLNARLPGDPVIRLTDFAHQCVRINGIRVIFNDSPSELVIFSGETVNVWWVTELWGMIYWDFVPALLNDPIFSSDSAQVIKLVDQLWASREYAVATSKDDDNSVAAYLKYPQNTLLGMEIAKTLYFKRRFLEAEEVTRILLSANALNMNARAMRISIYRNYAIEAMNFTVAETMFKRAEKEACFVLNNQHIQADEDFIFEYVVVKIARAMTILRLVRQGRGAFEDRGKRFGADDVIRAFDEAEDTLFDALAVSPTGYRSLYLILSIHLFRLILGHQPELFSDPDLPFRCDNQVIKQYMLDFILSLGFIREEAITNTGYRLFDIFVNKALSVHDESIALDAYRASIQFGFIIILWDIVPYRNAAIALRVLRLLKNTITTAEKLKQNSLYIYSHAAFLGEIIDPDDLIHMMKRVITAVEKRAGSLKTLEQSDPQAPIDFSRDDLVLAGMFIR